jgi:hypothetical protein
MKRLDTIAGLIGLAIFAGLLAIALPQGQPTKTGQAMVGLAVTINKMAVGGFHNSPAAFAQGGKRGGYLHPPPR